MCHNDNAANRGVSYVANGTPGDSHVSFVNDDDITIVAYHPF